MHEMGVATSIVQIVSSAALANQACAVTAVTLRIGEAQAIAPASLTFCFAALTADDPVLRNARLDIITIPHCGHCQACGQDFAIANFLRLCPVCGSTKTAIISGMEFEIVDIDIEVAQEEIHAEGSRRQAYSGRE